MAFDPCDPYSSAMDNIPLKDLFPNVKVRKRAHSRKIETLSDMPSLGNIESQETVRSKLRKSLTDALKPDSFEGEALEGKSVKSEESPHLGDSVKKEEDLNIEHETPHKRMKMEVDVGGGLVGSDQAEKVAVAIEAELFRHFGEVNRKYKEKARSLLFNLKDRSNPELRVRVLSGKLSPENLCTMNAEQLASRELSQWRQAKAEEFAHMVVLTEGDGRLVKKTHKGEFFTEVKVDKDDVLTEVVTAGAQQRVALGTKQATDESGGGDHVFDDENDSFTNDEEMEVEHLGFSPIRGSLSPSMLAAGDHVASPEDAWADDARDAPSSLEEDKDVGLPTIMSLDEYLGSRKERMAKLGVKNEEVESHTTTDAPGPLTSSKGKALRKVVGSPKARASELGRSSSQKEKKKGFRKHEKLWEGSFQLSGCLISPVLALYKSGDAVDLQNWPKLIEIKGRVRLDALEKFLQELHLSKTRSILIITCSVGEQADNGTSVTTLKEAASHYQRGERVGYAEPIPGFEMYLFPGGGTSLGLLVEHGYLNADQIVKEEEGILIGCVVCRKSTVPSTTQKSSSQYFTAYKHALSAQLDSPTRPNEVQWSRTVPSSKTSPSSKSPSSSVKPQISSPSTNNKADFQPRANQSLHTGSQTTWAMQSSQAGMSPTKEEEDDDLPPGFAPKSMATMKHGIELSTAQNGDNDDDDDDLPEFDFASSQASMPPLPPNFSMPPPLPDDPRVGTTPLPPPPPLGVPPQPSFPHGSMFPLQQPPQSLQGSFMQPVGSNPLSSLNASRFPGQILGHVHGIMDHTQTTQQAPFHALPRPPPGPVPRGQPFNIFSLRPSTLPGDGMFVPRPPSIEQRDQTFLNAIINQPPQNQAILPRPFGNPPRPEQFHGRPELPVMAGHLGPQAHPQNMTGALKEIGNSKSWDDDDDDMPEWCPPTIMQREAGGHQAPLVPNTSLIGGQPRGHVKAVVEPVVRPSQPLGRGGWHGIPRAMVSEPNKLPLHAEERGILRAPVPSTLPPPALRYPAGTWIRPGAPSGTRMEHVPGERVGHIRGRPSADPREAKRAK